MGHFESRLLVHFSLRYKASKYGVFTHINHFHNIFATLLSSYLSTNQLINMIQCVPCLKLILLHPVEILASQKNLKNPVHV